MSNIIEGLWDCSFCGSKGIRGRDRECPHCGKSRGEDTVFYINSSAKKLSNEEAKGINKNPDWLCNFCNCLNSDSNSKCKSCGATKEDSIDYFQNRRKQEAKKNEIQQKEQDWLDSITNKRKERLLRISLITILSIILMTLAIIGVVKIVTPKIKEATVNELSWHRSISIEAFQTFDESGWTLPIEARLKYTKRELKETRQVIDHYEEKTRIVTESVIDHYEEVQSGTEDLGNGYFEIIYTQVPVYKEVQRVETYQEPVYQYIDIYDDKYYYEIDRWVVNRNIESSGNNQEPFWGEVLLANNEREGNRTEEYMIEISDDKGRDKTMILSYDQWIKIKKGQKINVKVVLGKITDIMED